MLLLAPHDYKHYNVTLQICISIQSGDLYNKLGINTYYPKFTVVLIILPQGALGNTLREVHPTFFFGVPRYPFLLFIPLLSSLLLPPFFSPFTSLSFLPLIHHHYYYNDITKRECNFTVVFLQHHATASL